MVSVEFFFHIKSFRSHYGPGVDSASNRNEYQQYLLWGKGGRYERLTTLQPSCAVVTKSGKLHFLEDSEPLQACNATDLPLPLHCNSVSGLHRGKLLNKYINFFKMFRKFLILFKFHEHDKLINAMCGRN